MKQEVPQLITAADVAKILAVSERRVQALARNGILPAVRVGRQLRFDEEALKAWIKAGGKTETGDADKTRMS